VTVRTSKFSDESNGSLVKVPSIELIATRDKNIFTFYSVYQKQIRFERAFVLNKAKSSIKLGFFVQSPLSEHIGASGCFEHLNISHKSLKHVRL